MKIIFRRIYVLIVTLLFICPLPVYANSSWHWVTYSPQTLLPYAILLTLLIEIAGIIKIGKIDIIKKTIIVVTLANVISFIFPYIERAIRFRAVAGGFIYAWSKAFNSGPYYMIMFGYLIMTLILEIPLVYFFLKNHSKNKKHLLYLIIATNFITTTGVFIMERVISHGQW